MKMLEEINVIIVRNYSIRLHKWKIIIVASANRLLLKKRQNIFSLICQLYKKNWRTGLINRVLRDNGLKMQLLRLKPGCRLGSGQNASQGIWNGGSVFQYKGIRKKFFMSGLMLPLDTYRLLQIFLGRTMLNGGNQIL